MFRCEMEHFPDIRFANCRVRSQVGEQGRAVVQLDLSEAHYWFLDWDQLSSVRSSVRTLHTLIACLARHPKHHKPLTLQSHMRPGQTAPASDFKLCQNTNPHQGHAASREHRMGSFNYTYTGQYCHIVKSISAPGVIAYLIVDVVCKCTRCHVTDSFLVKYVSWVETLNHELPTSLFYPSSQLVWFTRVEKEF